MKVKAPILNLFVLIQFQLFPYSFLLSVIGNGCQRCCVRKVAWFKQ
jgi:hypothetical protein